MHVAMIITTPDYAGLNIKNNLLENYPFEEVDQEWEGHKVYQHKEIDGIKIYTIDKKCVHCENIDKEINGDIFLFPTTHRSAAGTNSLSCHTQGNWGNADLGGIPKNLSIAPALYLKKMLIELNNYADIDEEIAMECTHHGPELEKPTIFCEIGSDEAQWKRPELGKILADVIMKSILEEPASLKTAVGIGGPHYCNNFQKIQLNSDIAIGHICPKYNLENLDEEMIRQAIEKTQPKAELVLLDWKGLGKEKQRIIGIVEKLSSELGVEVKRTNQVEK